VLGFVAWHLIDANHGGAEMVWQFRWRASGDDLHLADWLMSQARFVGEGLGPVSLAALLAAPFLARGTRRDLMMLALLAAPGVMMELVFRQGSFKHAFWGYLLPLPAAFGVALAVRRWPRAGAALVAVQAMICVAIASQRLIEEHAQDQLGTLAASLPRGAEVPVIARGAFHPYVSWYARGRPVTVRTVDELPQSDGPALVDTAHLTALGCRAPKGGSRWQVMPMAEVRSACGKAEPLLAQ
jgi:hypothetical protein